MDRLALITGASAGIGKEFARLHAAQKGDLILVARRKEQLQELKAELEQQYQVKVIVIAKDLSQPQAAQEIFDEVQAQGLTVEYLINNAGFGGQGKFYERSWAQDQAMIQVNVIALSQLTRLFLPGMLQRNQGRILNVSSTASLMPGPLQATYFATKAFVTSLSNALAEELSNTKVTVTALLPGATATEFAAVANLEKTALFKQAYSAQSVAQIGYKAMLAGKLNAFAAVSFSQRFMLRLVPLLPTRWAMKIVRKMQEQGV